ncbi:WcaG Nucleoside-diphosphate-sugar epimerases [uncultured Caudovirales phage]|uniref:WcaG Nucleoside-diphosphate-sugar epimerases n=1 Tax=uncultured Caudovirales phage TaxID=2100421 RepID=A0A6J5LGH9_9CAUD|nr:WcaG Nucleoside-diphosphate-sugar epimerases [uncultured Caudovirales phage]
MKILITGNKGFIGSHFEKFWRDVSQDRNEIITYEWDENLMPRIEGLDWVFHFGAISATTERDVAKVMKQNVDFSVWLYEECRKYDVDMQWASSASVYGSSTDFRESSPVDPRSPYSWSKYLFEHYVEKHPTHRKCQGFRYFNVYGPEGEEHKGTQASPFCQFKRQAETMGIIKVFEGSENLLRDFVHVDELIKVQYQFMSQDVKENGIWNIGTGTTMSFMDVAKKYADQYGALIQEIPMPENLKASYQYYTCADLTKLRQTIKI